MKDITIRLVSAHDRLLVAAHFLLPLAWLSGSTAGVFRIGRSDGQRLAFFSLFLVFLSAEAGADTSAYIRPPNNMTRWMGSLPQAGQCFTLFTHLFKIS